MTRHYALVIALTALVALLVLVRGPGVPRPAFADAAQTATAAVQATQTANAATATAIAATPHPDRPAKMVRDLSNVGPSNCDFGLLIQALWDGRQTGGALAVSTPATTPGATVDVAAITAMVHGVYLSKAAAAATAITACGNTDSTHYKKCTVCVNNAGTLRFEPGTAVTGAQANALKPPCRDGETEVAYLELPTSFTSNTTTVTAGMLKQATTRASAVSCGGL